MPDITVVLDAIQSGDPEAPAQLLPVVYEELRQLASRRLTHEAPGQTLQPPALVHEAYLRLVGDGRGQHWDGRNHFFVAAAEAMRRILIDNARRKRSLKRGGARVRRELDEAELLAPEEAAPWAADCSWCMVSFDGASRWHIVAHDHSHEPRGGTSRDFVTDDVSLPRKGRRPLLSAHPIGGYAYGPCRFVLRGQAGARGVVLAKEGGW
jgi:hypothetical protein